MYIHIIYFWNSAACISSIYTGILGVCTGLLKVLADSGIKEIVERRFDEIVQRIKVLNPKNAYEVQGYINDVVQQFAHYSELTEKLQNGAHKAGVDIATELLVGSIYIRDRVLVALNFNADHINGQSK